MKKASTSALRRYAKSLELVRIREEAYKEQKKWARLRLNSENQVGHNKKDFIPTHQKDPGPVTVELRKLHQKECKKAKLKLKDAHKQLSKWYNALCKNFIK